VGQGGVDELFDETAAGVVLRVHVQPRAGRDVVTGRHGDALKVRVTAAPTDGRANEAVARQLADAFGVPVAAVELVTGRTSRSKRFRLTGLAPADVRRRLEALVAADRGPGKNPDGSPVER
jgi:uncharacterized protein (TIGR00251 family)